MSRDAELDLIQLQTGMDRAQAHYHQQGREILRLRLASPLRPREAQFDLAGTPLFDPGLGL